VRLFREVNVQNVPNLITWTKNSASAVSITNRSGERHDYE
jgi:hypothetical protein